MDGAAGVIRARRAEAVELRPWSGIGRRLHEALTFAKGKTDYEIFYGLDRLSEPHAVKTGIAFHDAGREIARIACRP